MAWIFLLPEKGRISSSHKEIRKCFTFAWPFFKKIIFSWFRKSVESQVPFLIVSKKNLEVKKYSDLYAIEKDYNNVSIFFFFFRLKNYNSARLFRMIQLLLGFYGLLWLVNTCIFTTMFHITRILWNLSFRRNGSYKSLLIHYFNFEIVFQTSGSVSFVSFFFLLIHKYMLHWTLTYYFTKRS